MLMISKMTMNSNNSIEHSTTTRTFAKSRFQVIPRVDMLVDSSTKTTTTGTGITTSAIATMKPDTGYDSNNANTPIKICDNNDDVDEQSLAKPLFDLMMLEEEENENNTITTTITSSSSSSSSSSTNSFYNTLNYYKYKKLKENDTSLDTLYIPMYIQRQSMPHPGVIGISFYNQRVLVYRFLQRPQGIIAASYNILVSLAVFCFLVCTIISTSSKYSESFKKVLNYIDYFFILFFIVEFVLRLWSSECVSYYRGWKGKIRFFRNPIRIFDLLIIIISLAVLISNNQGELLITSIRGVQFIQIFQMFRLDFKLSPWRMMASVVYSQRIHLAIVFYMGFLALIIVSFVMYFVEKDHNEDFQSLAASMWWAVVTLCTIGYGDMYPKTSTGKFLACICSLIGVSIFALPAGILGTGLALKVQEQQRQLKISKRKQPAARLIQCAWKLYVAEQELMNKSTPKVTAPSLSQKPSFKLGGGDVFIGNNNNGLDSTTNIASNNNYRSVIWKRYESNNKNKNKTKKSRSLNQREMNGLMFLFSVKFCIAKRDFVKAFKPYDIKDVLEQYAAGHADMLDKIRIMDHRLEKIQSNTMSVKAQHEIRLRFANHLTKLEYEFQKMQTNLNELLNYQINSKLAMENLFKYLMEQKSSSSLIECCRCCPVSCKKICCITSSNKESNRNNTHKRIRKNSI